MSEDLKQVIQQFVGALSEKDHRKRNEIVNSILVDRSMYAGPHRGLVVDAKEFFEKYAISLGFSLKFYIKSIIVEGDHACVQWEDEAVMEDGREYYNYGVFVMVFEGKKIKSIVEYVDTLRYLALGKRWDGNALMRERLAVPY